MRPLGIVQKIAWDEDERTCTLGLYFSPNDDVSVNCCSSPVCGSSTCTTLPRNPSSRVAPGVGSDLASWKETYHQQKVLTEEGYRHTYQEAILWHAASSIGTPCVWNKGPKMEARAVNRAGYWWCVSITKDRCGDTIVSTVKYFKGEE